MARQRHKSPPTNAPSICVTVEKAVYRLNNSYVSVANKGDCHAPRAMDWLATGFLKANTVKEMAMVVFKQSFLPFSLFAGF